MNLTENPETVAWPDTHYVFVEKVGPFQKNAPEAWGEAHAIAPALAEHNQITGYMSLYKMGTQQYRAGFALSTAPQDLPKGLTYEKFTGGKYGRFVLTGPYAQLGEATGRAWKTAETKQLALRDAFAIEHYVNDPRVTPEEQLVTEILVPLK
jgi:effector-binding domain-containing protein